jgi:hypothetical protein
MKKNERIIQYLDLGIYGTTRATGITHKLESPKTLDQLMKEYETLRELGKANKEYGSKSKLEYRLEDMEERDDCWVLMINIVDTEAAHPVTQVVGGDENDREVITLDDNTGIESSAHVIIYKNTNAALKHLVLLEKANSLPPSKITGFLNHLNRESAKHYRDEYKLPHPSGEKGKTINVHCVIELYGHPSDEFKKELENGKINGIKLTSDMRKIKGYDAQAYPELIETEIKMEVGRVAVALSGGNWKHLNKALKYGSELDSAFVKVSFEDETGTGHTATLSTDTGQLWNAEKYVKKRKVVGFGNGLSTSFPVIHEGIINKILELE